MNKNKFDLKVTPIRLIVTLVSLVLSGFSGALGWNIPIFFFIIPIILVVFLTQPKTTK